MSLNKGFLRGLILYVLDQADLYSSSAFNLINGTIAQESDYGLHWEQLGGGPAKGIIQMEPFTENDIWESYLKYKPAYKKIIYNMVGLTGPDPERLKNCLVYQIIMCRLHYRRVKAALPPAHDVKAIAEYWKEYYNTPSGKGTVKEFIINYEKYAI